MHCDFRSARISIHAPPRGATRAAHVAVEVLDDFNSRPSARGDTDKQRRARAATTFQFTPLREGRLGGVNLGLIFVKFQFTPLREGRRRATPAERRNTHDFNSRPSARGDALIWKPCDRNSVFQFTPLREGRPCRFACCFLAFCISIHAPPRGATSPTGMSCLPAQNFNSRPSARGDWRMP